MKRGAVGFPISLDVEGRCALLVGGGGEALDKARRLLDAGARVRVVEAQPTDALREWARGEAHAELCERDFDEADLDEAELVFLCRQDRALAARLADEAQRRGLLLWTADDPEHSRLSMPAVARLGRARIAVTTGGAAPALAARLRERFEAELGERFATFVERLGVERERLRATEPDAEKRRARLRALLDGFELRIDVRYPDEE